jgi:hypothetical protein
MEKCLTSPAEGQQADSKESRLYVPYPGGDEKYDGGKDWRLYNPEKYRDPDWSPDKE